MPPVRGIARVFVLRERYAYDGATPADGDKVYFNLNLPEADNIVVTRAAASDLEKVIYNIRILAFDVNEECFYNEEVYNSTTAYQTSQALGLLKQQGSEYENCTLWVIANVGKWESAGGSYNFEDVTTLSELEAKYGYRILQGSGPGLRNCLPMAGKLENVNMTEATSVASPHTITMERALARVTFTVDVTNPNLEFYFDTWSVESLPRYTYVIPHGNTDFADENQAPTNYELYYPSEGNSTEMNLTTSGVNSWLTDINSQNYGFYTYENRAGGRLSSPDWDNLQGEAGDYAGAIQNETDPSGNNPKFKTLYAPEHASFLILTGLIREKDTQNVTSFAYKIALGANNTNDYNIERNHNYAYNIHINGVTYDDITVDAFDSRVHKAYALQISAPYSDQLDAHCDKRYLDVLASPGKVEVQLYNNRADAEADNNPITTKDWLVLSETDTYNIGIAQDESTQKEVTYSDTQNHRFYIYADENLSTSSCSVVLKVTHTPEQGSSEIVQQPVSRYYTYTQAGLIESNGLYVESYEEYGMNLDPYSEEGPVTGLQWGWSGYEINVYNTQNGFNNTATILGTQGNPGDFEDGSLYYDYAARYCNNKNRRDENGEVVGDRKWYLPAIDELLPLTESVNGSSASWTPTTMAGKEYWSSSVPTMNEVQTNPFQERLNNATWDYLFWLVIYEAWEWIFRDWVENPDSNYYYTKVAKAAKDGEEALDVQGEEDGYNLSTYYRRIEVKHIRCVRNGDN